MRIEIMDSYDLRYLHYFSENLEIVKASPTYVRVNVEV